MTIRTAGQTNGVHPQRKQEKQSQSGVSTPNEVAIVEKRRVRIAKDNGKKLPVKNNIGTTSQLRREGANHIKSGFQILVGLIPKPRKSPLSSKIQIENGNKSEFLLIFQLVQERRVFPSVSSRVDMLAISETAQNICKERILLHNPFFFANPLKLLY